MPKSELRHVREGGIFPWAYQDWRGEPRLGHILLSLRCPTTRLTWTWRDSSVSVEAVTDPSTHVQSCSCSVLVIPALTGSPRGWMASRSSPLSKSQVPVRDSKLRWTWRSTFLQKLSSNRVERWCLPLIPAFVKAEAGLVYIESFGSARTT